MGATGWDPQFRRGRGEFGTGAQHGQRDAVTNDVTIRFRVVQLMHYPEVVRGIRKQPVRNVAELGPEGIPSKPYRLPLGLPAARIDTRALTRRIQRLSSAFRSCTHCYTSAAYHTVIPPVSELRPAAEVLV